MAVRAFLSVVVFALPAWFVLAVLVGATGLPASLAVFGAPVVAGLGALRAHRTTRRGIRPGARELLLASATVVGWIGFAILFPTVVGFAVLWSQLELGLAGAVLVLGLSPTLYWACCWAWLERTGPAAPVATPVDVF